MREQPRVSGNDRQRDSPDSSVNEGSSESTFIERRTGWPTGAFSRTSRLRELYTVGNGGEHFARSPLGCKVIEGTRNEANVKQNGRTQPGKGGFRIRATNTAKVCRATSRCSPGGEIDCLFFFFFFSFFLNSSRGRRGIREGLAMEGEQRRPKRWMDGL